MAERQDRIHPAIGMARVGDALRRDDDENFYYIGPEVPGIPENVDVATGVQGKFKINGRVKPQAARFRIFEYEKDNDGKFKPNGEVKTSDATRTVKIAWTVHLANRKANFCEFRGQSGSNDPLFFSSYPKAPDLNVRNARKVKTATERKKWLELDPGPRSVNGGDTATVAHFAIDRKNKTADGTKLRIKTLGELRSDAEG